MPSVRWTTNIVAPIPCESPLRRHLAGTKFVSHKILIMGLPGAGKTTLAPMLRATVFNADEVRATTSRDLGFSLEDRIEHARRMGHFCDDVVLAGGTAIADFVCPTPETRRAFGSAFTVWVDRIQKGRFEDTNRLFVPPEVFNVRVTAEGTPLEWVEHIATVLSHRHLDATAVCEIQG